MPSGKTQLVDERDKYRDAEVYRAKTARTFEEAGQVDEAVKQWRFAADNANAIVALAAMYPTLPLDPMMSIVTGGSGPQRAALSRASGRAAYYQARAFSLLQGPPPVDSPTTVLHPFPLPSVPAPGSPEAGATPSTPEAAAQADADENATTWWLAAAAGAVLFIGWRIIRGG